MRKVQRPSRNGVPSSDGKREASFGMMIWSDLHGDMQRSEKTGRELTNPVEHKWFQDMVPGVQEVRKMASQCV